MSSERALNAFLRQYLNDHSSGRRRPLAEYQALFPGNDEVIAREFERYEDGGDPDRAPTVQHIGRFRLIEEIGRGGQGIVYLAEDEQLHRRVAIKILTGLGTTTADRIARFLREAEVASRLDHPGIATVYEVGMDAGIPFIAMRYIEGQSIAARISTARSELGPESAQRSTPVEIVDLLELFESAARTLHFAHEAGIVHRDIKPGNLIVTKDGTPVILDFGLAQDVEGDLATLTAPGDLMGTPAYMSPEQIAGQQVRVDRRTDVYSLGVSLYECLTLARPFDAPTREGLYQAILSREPPDPRRLNPAVAGDLRVVLEAALEKDRDRRYQTALDFAEDLRRVRLHEPVRAKPVGRLVRLGRWAQRNPILATALAGLIGVLAAGLATALVLLDASERERGAKEAALAAVTTERDAKNVALADYDRLGDRSRLERLAREASLLWPPEPSKIDALRGWITQAEDLMKRLPDHAATLDRIRTAASGGESPPSESRESESRPWRFQASADQFKHDTTASLVADLTAFGDPKLGLLAGVRHRLDFAESVTEETIGKYRAQWEQAIREIADPSSCPAYRGLRIKPQLGLIPIARDGSSGLWEFAHLQSTPTGVDPVPKRGDDGRLIITERTGLVFVLIPGGTFKMGAVAPTGDEDPGAANVDANARPEEGPVAEITLDPFFMSKYEMTQGQWLWVTGRNPSQYGVGLRFGTGWVDLRHPVETVSWNECQLWLGRLGLVIPTEAQWEYAARAGTTTPWWTGAGTEGLAKAGNLSDRSARDQGGPPGGVFENWDDGWPCHAPVGSLAPNPFGLHDVIGNVWEKCRDYIGGSYRGPIDPGDGLRHPPQRTHVAARGGSFSNNALNARSSRRAPNVLDLKATDGGIRPACTLR